ncbi:hypothetical protein HN51_011226 [Arachis hypogaea]|nr:uncharacterized protein DS421_3g74010 [Arachis hypogaea]
MPGHGDVAAKLCTYCGWGGHTVEVCYGKHSYPLGYPCHLRRPRFSDRNTTTDCAQRGGGSDSVNNVATSSPNFQNVLKLDRIPIHHPRISLRLHFSPTHTLMALLK